MIVYITTPMTLCIEGENMKEIADKYWDAVPECCISDNQDSLTAGSSKYRSDLTGEFLEAYQYVTDGMDEEEMAEYEAKHPEFKTA